MWMCKYLYKCRYMPGIEEMGYMIVLVFKETRSIVLIVTALVYSPSKNVLQFHFLTSMLKLIVVCTPMMASLSRIGWNLKVVLICISLIIKSVKHFLKHLLFICSSSFETFFVSVPWTTFNFVACLLDAQFFSSLYSLDINLLIHPL